MIEEEDDDLFEEPKGAAPGPLRYSSPLREPCPKCGSHDIRRSNTEGFRVTLNQVFGRWPFRCRACRGLFFRPAPPPRR